MRAVVQRVSRCEVSAADRFRSSIGPGLLVYLGVAAGDGEDDLGYLVDKISGLRIFPDDSGRMNRSVLEQGGEVLVVSQFTLCGDARRGRRPSFSGAAAAERAKALYRELIERLQAAGLRVSGGRFRAHMRVAAVNDGPVTILLDSTRTF